MGPVDQSEHLRNIQVTISKEEAIAGRVAQHVRELEKEVEVLKNLNHRNIVRYLVSTSFHFEPRDLSLPLSNGQKQVLANTKQYRIDHLMPYFSVSFSYMLC